MDAESIKGHPPASLLVFSDDWGRHPSSCQHLIRHLLPERRVLWVNTIGTRTPKLDMATTRRALEKLSQWRRDSAQTDDRPSAPLHPHLRIVSPKMWPWFTRPLDRRLNAHLLTRQLIPYIQALPQPVRAITTLPITADLVGRLPVDSWIYYCVDDFGQWPGLDGNTLQRMDVDMTARADRIVAVSEYLRTLIAERGRSSDLLTHGVDGGFWQTEQTPTQALPATPRVMFWGVIDQRLNTDMLRQLSQHIDGNILLVGPQQAPDPQLLALPNVHTLGPRPLGELPALARAADVLVMPYADLPVTRAMQPLKMKEYIATGQPVVVSALPAVQEWRDCMDVVSTPTDFAATVLKRLRDGLPEEQKNARQRIASENWAAKAITFDRIICGVEKSSR